MNGDSIMEYRELGNTGIKVSEIAFGAEFLVQRPYEDTEELIKACEENGINFVDCWMSEPDVMSHLGKAIKGNRENWVIQGHIGSTWQNEQYVRTRDMDKVIPAFEDFMERFQIDTLDFGMIHYVDQIEDYEQIMNGPFIEYVRKLKDEGTIAHIGLSTHNPDIGILAAKNPEIELLMFSINPAYDMFGSMPDIEEYRKDDAYDGEMFGLNPQRAEIYKTASALYGRFPCKNYGRKGNWQTVHIRYHHFEIDAKIRQKRGEIHGTRPDCLRRGGYACKVLCGRYGRWFYGRHGKQTRQHRRRGYRLA